MYMHSSELLDRLRSYLAELEKYNSENNSLKLLLEDCKLEIEMLNGRIDVLTQECHWLNSMGNRK